MNNDMMIGAAVMLGVPLAAGACIYRHELRHGFWSSMLAGSMLRNLAESVNLYEAADYVQLENWIDLHNLAGRVPINFVAHLGMTLF